MLTWGRRLADEMRGALSWMLLARYLFLLAGLALLGYAIGLIIRANSGLDPWSVLSMGLHKQLPITFGRGSQLSGLAVVAATWLLGRRPTLATVLNMYFVGFFYDLFNRDHLLPAYAHSLPMQALLLAGGAALMTFGMAWYLSANLGAGPRDSFMLALLDRLGWRVRVVRWSMGGFAITSGVLLGGPVGVGTVVSLFLTGQLLEYWLRLFRWVEGRQWIPGLIQVPVKGGSLGIKAENAAAVPDARPDATHSTHAAN